MSLHLGFSTADLIRGNRVNKNEIDYIRAWNETIQDVPLLTDEQIVVFLLCCERNIEFTQKAIKENYKAKFNSPDLFNDRDIDEGSMRRIVDDLAEIAILPKRTEDGSGIAILRLKNFDYRKFNLKGCMKISFMMVEAMVYNDPPTGFIVLFDMTGLGFMHCTQIRMHLVKVLCHYAQEGLPTKLKAVHVLNSTWVVKNLLAFVKPFLDRRVYESIHIHSSDENIEEFYKMHVPKSCLPADYGGELPEMKVLHVNFIQELQEIRPYFLEEEKQRKLSRKNIKVDLF